MVPKVDLISTSQLLFLAQYEHHCSFRILKPKICHNDCSSHGIYTDENNVHTNSLWHGWTNFITGNEIVSYENPKPTAGIYRFVFVLFRQSVQQTFYAPGSSFG